MTDDTQRSSRARDTSAYLCFAYGESDLPVAVIATSREAVLQFFVDEWWGEKPEGMHPENREQWNAAVAEFDSHDWREEGPLEWKFEIGGITITQIAAPLSETAPSVVGDHIYCTCCEQIQPLLTDQMPGKDVSGKFEKPVDLICGACRLVIATTYSEPTGGGGMYRCDKHGGYGFTSDCTVCTNAQHGERPCED